MLADPSILAALVARLQQETGLPALSSPRLALGYTRQVLERLPDRAQA